jgi:hypothetical protein
MKTPIEAHRWFLTAHEVSLQEGLLLLGLALAQGYLRLPNGWPMSSAWLLIGAGAAGFLRHRQRLVRHPRSVRRALGGLGPRHTERGDHTAGLLIIAWGVVRAC